MLHLHDEAVTLCFLTVIMRFSMALVVWQKVSFTTDETPEKLRDNSFATSGTMLLDTKLSGNAFKKDYTEDMKRCFFLFYFEDSQLHP